MHLKLIRLLGALGIILSSVLLSASAQQPAAQAAKQVKILAVTMEPGMAAGNRTWMKVVTQFQSTPRWADGVAFSYNVLLGVGDQYRVLPGTVRYANVKGGVNRAVMYISPNTVERFGVPLAAHIRAFYKDDLADEFTYKGQGAIPQNWETQINKYPGLLMTVINTPWVISDYSASPDIFGQ